MVQSLRKMTFPFFSPPQLFLSSFRKIICRIMDQLTIKTPNPKCRLYWCLRVYRLETQSVMLVFSTQLSLTFSLVSSPLRVNKYTVRVYTYTVRKRLKERRRPQTDKSLYRSTFLITTFDIAFYQSNLSTCRIIADLFPAAGVIGWCTAGAGWICKQQSHSSTRKKRMNWQNTTRGWAWIRSSRVVDEI